MHVSKPIWPEALQVATYLINRMPSYLLAFKSPIELIFLPSQLFSLPIETLGCICFVYMPKFEYTNWIQKPLTMVSLVIPRVRKGIGVIILLFVDGLYP